MGRLYLSQAERESYCESCMFLWESTVHPCDSSLLALVPTSGSPFF